MNVEDDANDLADAARLAKRGDFPSLKKLWDAGQRFDLATVFERAVTDFRTVKRNVGHLQILEFCIDQGLDPMTRADWMDQSLIGTASMVGNVEIVDHIGRTVGFPDDLFVRAALGDVPFLKQRATASEIRLQELHDDNGFNLLHYAVASGLGRRSAQRKSQQEATCEFLIENKVSTTFVVEKEIPLTPALFCAWYCGNPVIMQMLLDAGEIQVGELHQVVEFALEPHQRSGKPFVEVAGVILENGFDINSARPDQARTLLHGSSNRGSTTAVAWLLEHGAEANIRDDHGRTSLHVAAIRNVHTSVIKRLLEHGAETNALDNAGKTALDLATENGRDKVVDFLSNYGGGLEA